MLETLSKYSQINIKLNCKGDLNIDEYDTVDNYAQVIVKFFCKNRK